MTSENVWDIIHEIYIKSDGYHNGLKIISDVKDIESDIKYIIK